jgi:hypothetical protein
MSSLVEHIPSQESDSSSPGRVVAILYGNASQLLLHKCSPFELILSQLDNFSILTNYFFKNECSIITSHASKSSKRPIASLLSPVLLHTPSSLIYGLKNICGSLQEVYNV